jgi:hypothetical protein
VPPAKSSPPRTKDQPLLFQVQHAIGSGAGCECELWNGSRKRGRETRGEGCGEMKRKRARRWVEKGIRNRFGQSAGREGGRSPYTRVLHTKTKTSSGPRRPRSATAPIAIIGLWSVSKSAIGRLLRAHGACSETGHARDGSEHELIDAEDDGGDAAAPDGGFFEYAFEAEVFWRGLVSRRVLEVCVDTHVGHR